MAMNREACQVWFGDDQQRQLTPREMYLAVYVLARSCAVCGVRCAVAAACC